MRAILLIGLVFVTVCIGIALPTTAYGAVPSGDNVLRGWCTPHRHTTCVDNVGDGMLTVRTSTGHLRTVGDDVHYVHGQRLILRYLRHHAHPCPQEDSPRCYWNAGVTGNHRGHSFIVVGGHAEGTGTVIYL